MTSSPSMPGRPRSRIDDVGVVPGGQARAPPRRWRRGRRRSRGPAGWCRAPAGSAARRRRRGPGGARGRHRRPAAAARRPWSCPPPRGVLDGELAAHRPGEAAGDGQAEARRRRRAAGGRRGAGTAGRPARARSAAMPGPRSTTRSSDPVAHGAGLDPHRRAVGRRGRRRCRPGWRRPARAGPGRRAPAGSVSGTSTVDVAGAAVPRPASAAGTTSSRPTARSGGRDGAGLDAAHVEQVRRRARSSRSVSSSMVARNSSRSASATSRRRAGGGC